MDMLFLEEIVSSQEFADLFLSEVGMSGASVVEVEHSKTHPEYGESDMTIIVEQNGKRYGLLIEDKIDAIAMPDQYSRYIKRGEYGVANGDYENFSVFMVAPEKYLDEMVNNESGEYPIQVSYEECFIDDFDGILTLDNGYNEVPSFLEVTSEYDEAFFENNTLFVVYVSSTTGSERFDVKDVIIENSRLRVHVEQTNNPEIGTEDMAGWFMIVEIKDEHIADCEYFDAVFGGIEKEEVMKHKSENFIFYKTDVDKLPMDTHNIKGVYQSKLDENTGYMTYTDARYHSLFIGQVLTLFGNADDITDNYEDLVSYVVAAEKEDGTIIYLEVYYGSSGPAIGGLDTEDYLLAAQELEQLIMSAKASDYEIKIEYEDLDVVFKMGVKNGVPYYG